MIIDISIIVFRESNFLNSIRIAIVVKKKQVLNL